MSSSKLDHALSLAAEGFWVFPVKPDQKTPAVNEWQRHATRENQTLHSWFEHQDLNIGIFTGRFMDDEALIVVDVDTKNSKDGNHALLALELQGLDLPETRETATPTGGRHIFFRVPRPVRQGANLLGDGCDIRSRGGYCVGAGSTIGGVPYEVRSDLPVAPAPDWLLARLAGPTRERSESPLDEAPAVPPPSALPRAVHYLQNDAPHGQGGSLSDSAYKVACRTKDLGVDRLTCIDLMLEHWPHSPVMDREDMAVRVNNAYRYGLDPVGVAAPERDFEPVKFWREEGGAEEVLDPHEKLNQEFAFVVIGGGHGILWQRADQHGKPQVVHLSEDTFHKRLAALKIQMGKREMPLTKDWMEWSGRRSYDGIVFMPGLQAPERYYNNWAGFVVEPALPGSRHPAVDAFLEHALKNICRGDDELYRWLIGYFAHIVQRPWEKPLVSLVFRGGKGVGKNALVERVGDLLGSHCMVSADKRYLTGNFNSHLEKCLMLVLDEAFWSGDKTAEGIVKSLITGSHHVIEHKGKEPYRVDNRTRVFILGNETWIIPASHDERRFAVFDVGDGRKQDRAFFQGMKDGMAAGGSAVLLRYLMDFDLTAFDCNAAPSTAALLEQKHSSLEPLSEWWLGNLLDGTILGGDFEGWPRTIEKERFRQAFERYAKSRNIKGRLPGPRAIGALLKPWGIGVGRIRIGAALPYTYELPALEDARAAWDAHIGHKVGWGE